MDEYIIQSEKHFLLKKSNNNNSCKVLIFKLQNMTRDLKAAYESH